MSAMISIQIYKSSEAGDLDVAHRLADSCAGASESGYNLMLGSVGVQMSFCLGLRLQKKD